MAGEELNFSLLTFSLSDRRGHREGSVIVTCLPAVGTNDKNNLVGGGAVLPRSSGCTI